MPTPEIRPDASIQTRTVHKPQSAMPVEFIELGLALELLADTYPDFTEALKAALLTMDGELLFELPDGAEPSHRVAAIRLAYAGSADPRVAFLFHADDGDTRIEPAETQAEHLRNFAQSFVDVLEKIAHH